MCPKALNSPELTDCLQGVDSLVIHFDREGQPLVSAPAPASILRSNRGDFSVSFEICLIVMVYLIGINN